jgi:hypothetical protein
VYMIAVVVLGIGLMGLVIGVGWISRWEEHLREEHRGHM